jgi:glycerol-3-phosphate dehydrogenase
MHDIIQLNRDPNTLKSATFDLVIVGAGIFGACAAWEAVLRGYSVALIEQHDFCSGVSANSYKIVHGGIRYIQHLDVPRVRSSCHERSTLLRIAPHLVTPLPIAIPTYGLGMSGRPILATGTCLYDLITADRNRRIIDPSRRIPWAKILGRQDVLDLFPGLDTNRLTGAVQFSDAQMYNPPRLVLAFLQSAVSRGAVICNYTKATGFNHSGDRLESVRVRDELNGNEYNVRAKAFLNAAGPWTDGLLSSDKTTRRDKPGVYSRDACFVVPRRFSHNVSVAIMGQTRDPDAVMSREARHLFVVPWRDYSLIGTWHKVVSPDPDEIGIAREEIETFIEEMHAAYPDLNLSPDEVQMCNWGLVPFGEDQKGGNNLSYGKRSILIDHGSARGPSNLVSLIGIRYTMGRGDSSWALKSIAKILGDKRSAPATDQLPIYGGDFDDFDQLRNRLSSAAGQGLADEIVTSLAHNHGSNAVKLVEHGGESKFQTIAGSHVLVTEVENAVTNEMAMTLGDIVFRRTDLASGGSPGDKALEHCADIAARLLRLTDSEKQQQLADVRSRIPGWS